MIIWDLRDDLISFMLGSHTIAPYPPTILWNILQKSPNTLRTLNKYKITFGKKKKERLLQIFVLLVLQCAIQTLIYSCIDIYVQTSKNLPNEQASLSLCVLSLSLSIYSLPYLHNDWNKTRFPFLKLSSIDQKDGNPLLIIVPLALVNY